MISLSRARAAVDELLADAGGPVCVAVVDGAGAPIVVVRSDGARAFSVDVAVGKARTAAAFGHDTASLEEEWSTRPVFAHSLITQGGWFVGRGGVPVVRDGEVLGAVGVSGNEPGREVALAEEAARRLSR